MEDCTDVPVTTFVNVTQDAVSPDALRCVLSVITGNLSPPAGHPKWTNQSVYKANPHCYKGKNMRSYEVIYVVHYHYTM